MLLHRWEIGSDILGIDKDADPMFWNGKKHSKVQAFEKLSFFSLKMFMSSMKGWNAIGAAFKKETE